jgi:hypothetical protein
VGVVRHDEKHKGRDAEDGAEPTGMIVIQDIVPLQDGLTRSWHDQPDGDFGKERPKPAAELETDERVREEWLRLVARQHHANFDLWHIEDEARRPGASDTNLASVKRRIDLTNQLRNDLVEDLDRFLLRWLEKRELPKRGAALHSETPGLIIDRLSILSLKIYHTREEAQRPHAPAGHEERNRERLAILEKQRRDLAGCLGELWQEILDGKRRFELYRQMKMYNDPTLNPAIYSDAETNRGEKAPS